MPETFEILARFLERFDEEVEGRELQEPAEDIQLKLRQLASGNLPTAERAGLFAELNRHPQWIAWLAQQIKASRTNQA